VSGYCYIGGGSSVTNYAEVAAFANLPAAASHTGEDYIVQTSSGIWPISRNPAGLYRSNGTSWLWLGDVANDASEVAFAPVGGIAAVTVQDAVAELDTEKLATTHAGSGGSAHANAVAAGAAGFMTGADKTKLDAITGTNTGDQTITLSGDVSGSGTGAITTAIGAGKVTLAMQANMATASVVYRKTAGAGAPEVQALATLKTDLGLTGTNSGDQTSIVGITGTVAQFNTAITDADIAIAARNINTTAPITGGGDLSADRTIAISAATSGAAGSMSAADKSKLDGIASAATANSTDATLTAPYRTLLDSSGSHIAARVAGTYGFGHGDPVAITGTGTLYPLNIIQITAADYPSVGALAAKLRVKVTVNCNDVAPGHNFVFGLHPVTRPATSGGAGLCIYTIGAAVAGSTVTATTPAADSSAAFTGADFALPADGQYVLGVVTNGTTATSAHVHLSAALQLHHA
jgi:hypothetical protein